MERDQPKTPKGPKLGLFSQDTPQASPALLAAGYPDPEVFGVREETLDEDLAQIASWIALATAEHAQASVAQSIASAELKRTKSHKFIALKEMSESGIKMSEKTIEARVETDAQVMEAIEALHRTEIAVKLLASIVTGYKHKSDIMVAMTHKRNAEVRASIGVPTT